MRETPRDFATSFGKERSASSASSSSSQTEPKTLYESIWQIKNKVKDLVGYSATLLTSTARGDGNSKTGSIISIAASGTSRGSAGATSVVRVPPRVRRVYQQEGQGDPQQQRQQSSIGGGTDAADNRTEQQQVTAPESQSNSLTRQQDGTSASQPSTNTGGTTTQQARRSSIIRRRVNARPDEVVDPSGSLLSPQSSLGQALALQVPSGGAGGSGGLERPAAHQRSLGGRSPRASATVLARPDSDPKRPKRQHHKANRSDGSEEEWWGSVVAGGSNIGEARFISRGGGPVAEAVEERSSDGRDDVRTVGMNENANGGAHGVWVPFPAASDSKTTPQQQAARRSTLQLPPLVAALGARISSRFSWKRSTTASFSGDRRGTGGASGSSASLQGYIVQYNVLAGLAEDDPWVVKAAAKVAEASSPASMDQSMPQKWGEGDHDDDFGGYGDNGNQLLRRRGKSGGSGKDGTFPSPFSMPGSSPKDLLRRSLDMQERNGRQQHAGSSSNRDSKGQGGVPTSKMDKVAFALAAHEGLDKRLLLPVYPGKQVPLHRMRYRPGCWPQKLYITPPVSFLARFEFFFEDAVGKGYRQLGRETKMILSAEAANLTHKVLCASLFGLLGLQARSAIQLVLLLVLQVAMLLYLAIWRPFVEWHRQLMELVCHFLEMVLFVCGLGVFKRSPDTFLFQPATRSDWVVVAVGWTMIGSFDLTALTVVVYELVHIWLAARALWTVFISWRRTRLARGQQQQITQQQQQLKRASVGHGAIQQGKVRVGPATATAIARVTAAATNAKSTAAAAGRRTSGEDNRQLAKAGLYPMMPAVVPQKKQQRQLQQQQLLPKASSAKLESHPSASSPDPSHRHH
ncbi:hypothetical protein PLESTB_001562200 [Pleodorina starrii]|uniref:Uncharacterized protein n=1 Tax=Pleodorina starrii TaxID=330485 RepID=A0A9W6F897_9CHLO|nr:hypothetical protein PLESTB_001562200 [Pleodorina starrii]